MKGYLEAYSIAQNRAEGNENDKMGIKEAKPYQVRDARAFLETAGVKP